MPLVASVGGDEAFGSPSRFRDGVDHRLWRPWSPAGCGMRGPTPRADWSMRGTRPSSRYRQPAAAGLSGDDRALTAPAATKALTCARNRVNSKWRIAGASHTELAGLSSFLSGADSAQATFTVPKRRDVTDRSALDDGNWIDFELTVTDGDGTATAGNDFTAATGTLTFAGGRDERDGLGHAAGRRARRGFGDVHARVEQPAADRLAEELPTRGRRARSPTPTRCRRRGWRGSGGR